MLTISTLGKGYLIMKDNTPYKFSEYGLYKKRPFDYGYMKVKAEEFTDEEWNQLENFIKSDTTRHLRKYQYVSLI